GVLLLMLQGDFASGPHRPARRRQGRSGGLGQRAASPDQAEQQPSERPEQLGLHGRLLLSLVLCPLSLVLCPLLGQRPARAVPPAGWPCPAKDKGQGTRDKRRRSAQSARVC